MVKFRRKIFLRLQSSGTKHGPSFYGPCASAMCRRPCSACCRAPITTRRKLHTGLLGGQSVCVCQSVVATFSRNNTTTSLIYLRLSAVKISWRGLSLTSHGHAPKASHLLASPAGGWAVFTPATCINSQTSCALASGSQPSTSSVRRASALLARVVVAVALCTIPG